MHYHAELNELREIERLDHGKREGGAPQKLDIFYAEKSALFLVSSFLDPVHLSIFFYIIVPYANEKPNAKKYVCFLLKCIFLLQNDPLLKKGVHISFILCTLTPWNYWQSLRNWSIIET